MLKVLLVTNLYPNKFEPTRGIFTEQIVKCLRKRHEVEVVSPLPWLPNFVSKIIKNHKILPKVCLYNNVKVYHPKYVVIPKVGRWLYGLLFFIGIFNTLRKIKKSYNPDVINVHWMYPDGFGTVLAARILGIPVVTHSLGCDINESATYPSRRFFIRLALKWADFNISVSEELRKKIIQIGSPPNLTATIMNGVNKELFKSKDKIQLRQSLFLPENKTLFLYAGNFNIEKGLEVLICAFSKVHKKYTNALLVVLGSGPLEKQVYQLVSELGIAKKIVFVGRVTHDKVPDYLAAADFLCLPSLREGCPNIVLEALSTGIPVLSSKVGAVPEMLSSQQHILGLMAEPNSVEDFANIIEQSMSIDWQRPLKFDWMNWQESADLIGKILTNVVQLKHKKNSDLTKKV
jgi:teichuronic acid biosynthesis glycosyltransferase TuaC